MVRLMFVPEYIYNIAVKRWSYINYINAASESHETFLVYDNGINDVCMLVLDSNTVLELFGSAGTLSTSPSRYCVKQKAGTFCSMLYCNEYNIIV